MMEAWGWPQWTMIGFCALAVLTHAAQHGEKREYNVSLAFIGVVIELVILYQGGFFS